MAHATRINKKRGRRLGDQYGHLKRGTSNPTEMFIIHLGCSRTIYSPLRLVPKLVRLPQRRTSVARKYISNMFSTRVGMTFLGPFIWICELFSLLNKFVKEVKEILILKRS